MKYILLLLVMSFTGLSAQIVSWDSPNTPKRTTPQPTAEYQSAYNNIQSGYATYYADYLAGQPTASGEAYRLDQLTASHALLPTGTILLVTRQDNGASVKVRVNDNNGHSDGSIVVLSRQAAYQLGMLTAGKAQVSVQRVGFDNWNPRPSQVSSQMTARSVQPRAYGQVVQPNTRATANTSTASDRVGHSRINKPYYRPASYGSSQSTPDFADSPSQDQEVNKDAVARDPYAYQAARTQTVQTPSVYSGYEMNKPVATQREVDPAQYSNSTYTQPVSSPAVAPVNEVQIASNTVSQGYAIQLAAYGNEENAKRQVRSLQNQGVEQIYITSVTKTNGATINRVMVGPFSTAEAAQTAANSLERNRQITGIVTKL